MDARQASPAYFVVWSASRFVFEKFRSHFLSGIFAIPYVLPAMTERTLSFQPIFHFFIVFHNFLYDLNHFLYGFSHVILIIFCSRNYVALRIKKTRNPN